MAANNPALLTVYNPIDATDQAFYNGLATNVERLAMIQFMWKTRNKTPLKSLLHPRIDQTDPDVTSYPRK